MLTAGDEFGRTQRGNNNAYCHDSELTWLSWEREDWQHELHAVVRQLHPAAAREPGAASRAVRAIGARRSRARRQMDWYNKQGESMSLEDWDSPGERTLQYLAASTPEFEEFNRILLVVHGLETTVTVTLPEHEGVASYRCSGTPPTRRVEPHEQRHAPGEELVRRTHLDAAVQRRVIAAEA